MSGNRVDFYSQLKGVSYNIPCKVATTSGITLNGLQTIDSISLSAGDRVLVKNQSTSSENGIYIASSSSWSRAIDASISDDFINGSLVYVTTGATNTNTYELNITEPFILNTSSVIYKSYRLGINNTTSTSGEGNLIYWNDNLTGNGKLNISSMYQDSSGAMYQTTSLGNGELWADGNIIANYSDERLKKDFKLIDNAIEKVNKLRSVTYYQNDLGNKLMKKPNNEKQVGLIAQDLLKVLPEAVKLAPFDTTIDENGNRISKTGENYLTIQYEKLVPLLVSAIQELSKEIDRLKKL